MTRGNQREIDRARAQKRREKAGAKSKSAGHGGMSLEAKKERYVAR
jgi:4F5 protein family.